MADMYSARMGPLSRRATSAFPLSIGTSLLFESLYAGRFDPYDKTRIVEKVNPAGYNAMWLNVATLIRNIIGAVPKEDQPGLDPLSLCSAVEAEIEVIESIFSNEGQGLIHPTFYFCTYDRQYLHPTHKAIKLRMDHTPTQKFQQFLLMETMKLLFKRHEGRYILKLDDTLTPKEYKKSLIMTHFPYDLLSYTNFNQLDLIESHTGKLKTRSLWYTKYHSLGDASLNTLPFLRKLLLIFGDNVMFQPLDIKFRRMILEISQRRKWHPLTTQDRIMLDLSLDIREPYLLELIRKL